MASRRPGAAATQPLSIRDGLREPKRGLALHEEHQESLQRQTPVGFRCSLKVVRPLGFSDSGREVEDEERRRAAEEEDKREEKGEG